MRTLSQRMWRSMNSRLSGLYQYFHLVFGTSTYKPPAPNEDTIQDAEALFEILEKRHRRRSGKGGRGNTEEDLRKVQEVLDGCGDLDGLVYVTNHRGYNILQIAVLNDDTDFLKVLIHEGLDLNKGKCSLPLHLACKLGNLPLVKFLLHHGADSLLEMGMCHPKPHVPIRHVPSRFHFLETDIYACDSDNQLPVMYAIQHDHIDIVKCLIQSQGQRSGSSGGMAAEAAAEAGWPTHRQPLHHACKFGAYQSMCYLCRVGLSEVNETDHQGWTPMLHVVQWGKRYVEYLEANGANMHALTSKNQSALHLLYSKVRDPSELYETTKFLLGTGLEQDINVVDSSGNTALHVLIGQVNRNVESFSDSPLLTSLDQEAYNSQVLETLELLLRHNCDPNIINSSGITTLHKLILTFDFVISNDPTGITLETLPMREKYRVDFATLYSAIDVLLKHGADPNAATGAGRTPLVMLLHSMLDVESQRIASYQGGFLQCLSLLCDKGAQPSFTLPTHTATITTISKFGQKCLQERNQEVKDSMYHFLQDVLTTLLTYDLNSNHSTLVRRKDQAGGSGNLLVELVKLAQHIRQPSDFSYIHDWVLTALQWGADPDIEPYPSDPIICHSQSSIYLKPKSTQAVNQYMYHIQDFVAMFEGGHAERLLMLFYNSMDHDALYQCLNTAKFMSRFDPNSTKVPSHGFISLINNLATQPRSLQQMARVATYKAMDRQLKLRTSGLPLPPALRSFILNVD